MRFRDRTEAGQRLIEPVRNLNLADPVVLALPRGGVPIGFEVATALGAPLEVFVARKIGAPWHPETGIGAIAEGDVVVADRFALQMLAISKEQFDQLVDRERQELHRRVERYRGSRPLPELKDRAVILVDDGLATGVTAEASLRALRGRRPHRLVLAAPTCAADSAERLRSVADDVVCVTSPEGFYAVGQSYAMFDQTTDDEVIELLTRAGGQIELRSESG